MFVIQKSYVSYWSQSGEWDELSSAVKFENIDAAREVEQNIKGKHTKIITLEEAMKDEADTTPIPLRKNDGVGVNS